MRLFLKAFTVLTLLFIVLTFSASAQFDEMDDAFDLEEEKSTVDIEALKKEASQKPSNFSIDGFFREEYAYAYEQEQKKMAKLKFTGNVGFKYKFSGDWQSKLVLNAYHDSAAKINGTENYTDEELASQYESEVRDAFIEGPLSENWSIKTGRQILAWGQSDMLQINDVVNPRDTREVGMVELEDARIPVTSTLLQWVKDSWEVSLVGIHEFRPNKIAPKGSTYDRFATLTAQGITLNDEELPANGSEAVVRVFKSFNGGDIAFYTGETYGDSFYLDFKSLGFVAGSPRLNLTPKYKKIPFVGFSANKVSGSWLFKGEIAKKTGIPQRRDDFPEQIAAIDAQGNADGMVIDTYKSRDLHQIMAGLEYSGISDLSISLEIDLEQIQNYDDSLASKELAGSTFIMIRHSALNETLKTSLSVISLLNQNGVVSKLSTDYSGWKDGITFTGGTALYTVNNDNALLKPFEKNDRIFASMKFSY